MHGLRITPAIDLTIALEPYKYALDECYWFLNGYGASLAYDDEEYESWTTRSAAGRVGLPGWFTRYADSTDRDWSIYFACDGSAGRPEEALAELQAWHSQGVEWLGHARDWKLPEEVQAICRSVDDAYWDLFIRDRLWLGQLQSHLDRLDAVDFQCLD